MARFSSSGVLTYGDQFRAAISVDPGIVAFYRHLIPEYYYAQPQMHAAHITVVRVGVEVPSNLQAWGKHDGERVPFEYDSEIHYDGTYWYLNVHSARIGDIREELGLPRFRGAREGFLKCYHMTIANSKEREC